MIMIFRVIYPFAFDLREKVIIGAQRGHINAHKMGTENGEQHYLHHRK